MRFLAAGGLVAAVLHVATVLAIGRHDPRFWSPYHLVSEMGMPGKPQSYALNLVGFEMPGACIVALATATLMRLGTEGFLSSTLLALGGASFAAVGFFPWPSLVHCPAVYSVALLLTFGVWLMGRTIDLRLGVPWLPLISRFVALLIFTNLFVLSTSLPAPGYWQKLSLAAGMSWLSLVSCCLWCIPSADS